MGRDRAGVPDKRIAFLDRCSKGTKQRVRIAEEVFR